MLVLLSPSKTLDFETKLPTRAFGQPQFLNDTKILVELLKKQQGANTDNAQSKDKTALYIGCGVVGIVLIGLVLILVRRNKNNKKY